ncbi:MAG: hypothetical protein R3E68_21585 [Burkholderiaceae bacterium]
MPRPRGAVPLSVSLDETVTIADIADLIEVFTGQVARGLDAAAAALAIEPANLAGSRRTGCRARPPGVQPLPQ